MFSLVIVINGLGFADWFVYSLFGVFGVALFAIVWWFYNARLKIGNKAVITTVQSGQEVTWKRQGFPDEKKIVGGVRIEMASKEIKSGESEFVCLGKKFMVDLTKPFSRRFGWTFYYYDYKSGALITADGVFPMLKPDDADQYMSDALMKKALRMINVGGVGSSLLIIVLLVVFSAMSFGVGLLASPYILKTPAEQVPTVTRLVLGWLGRGF